MNLERNDMRMQKGRHLGGVDEDDLQRVEQYSFDLVIDGTVSYRANPVPSPVHRYKASTSRLRNCCSPKSSTILPRTCDKAERMTFRKFLCSYISYAPYQYALLLTWYSVFNVTTQAS